MLIKNKPESVQHREVFADLLFGASRAVVLKHYGRIETIEQLTFI